MGVLTERTARGDVLIRRGVTTTWAVRWQQSVDGVTFAPVDLSTWTGRLLLRGLAGELWLDALVACDTSGLAVATVTPEHTAADVWAGRAGGQWRIDLTAPDGHIERVGDGYFHLEG